MKINISETVAPDFREWLLAEGFNYQGNPSPLRFFDDMAEWNWTRKKSAPPIKDVKVPSQVGSVTLNVSDFAEGFLRDRFNLFYKNHNHLIADLVAGNWVRVEEQKEAA